MTKRLAPATVLLVSQSAGLAFVGFLVATSGESVPATRFLVYGILGGLAGAVGLAALYKGLAVGKMSIVAPTAALSGAVPVLVGFLRGERPALVQLVGMAVAGAGVLIAVRSPVPSRVEPAERDGGGGGPSREDGRLMLVSSGVGYALVAALLLGLFVTSLDAGGEGSPVWTALMVRASSVPLFALAWVLFRGDGPPPSARDLGLLAIVGVFDNGANILFAIATTRGLLTLVSVLGSLYPVSTVLLARVFLRERLASTQAAGVVAAFAGVALIAAG